MNSSYENPRDRSRSWWIAFTTTTYPIVLLLLVAVLLLESSYRPDGIPRFMVLGDRVIGPGFWSSWLIVPFGVLFASGIYLAFRGRFTRGRGGSRRAAVLLTLVGIGYVFLVGSAVALKPFRSEVIAVGDPSTSGCQLYSTRREVLSGVGGELLLLPAGDRFLVETGERWASRGGPEFDLNRYLEVSWSADEVVLRDVSGEDPNMFYYRGAERIHC